MESYIHHYTSIKTLASILSSGKIRFTRFDLLDDLMEVNIFEIPLLAKWGFVSSWTDDKEESIPMWKMYSSIFDGVRISLPIDMFDKHVIEPFSADNHVFSGSAMVAPLSKEELWYNGKYQILNCFSQVYNDFLKKVKYKDLSELKMEYGKLFGIKNYNPLTGRGDIHTNSSIWDLGKFKSKKWEFQSEVRFVLIAKPLLPLEHQNIKGEVNKQFDSTNINEKMLHDEVKYIYVPLNRDALKRIIITLPPCVTDADRIIVQSLAHRYVGNIKIIESDLKDHIQK